jgi:hypothetical protein
LGGIRKNNTRRKKKKIKRQCGLDCLSLWGNASFWSFRHLLRRGAGGALGSTALASVGRGTGGLASLLLGASGGSLALLLGRSRSAGANGADDDQDGGEQKSNQTASHLGNGLDSVDRILLGQANEVINLLANESDGVLLEGDGGTSGRRSLGLGLAGLLLSLLNGELDIEGLLAELLSLLDGVTDIDVVEQDVVLHGPDLETNLWKSISIRGCYHNEQIDRGKTYGAHGLQVGGSLVLKVGGVGNLARGPGTLVGRVVNHGSGPLALVLRVLDHGASPLAAARDLGALGVGNGGSEPVTILLIIPVFGLRGLGVRNASRLVIQPVGRLLSLLIGDLEGSLLIPVIRLGGLGVGNLDLVNPVGGLLVLGVVNLLLRVDGGSEVLQEAARLDRLAIDEDLKGLVRLDDQSVEGGDLGGTGDGGRLEVLLLVLAGLGVFVTEDEVDLEWEGVGQYLEFCIFTALGVRHIPCWWHRTCRDRT